MACLFPFGALLPAVLFAAAFTAASGVRADEAFLCGPDNIIYVKPSEIEQKKKTDPCVARSYGLAIEEHGAKAPENRVAESEAPGAVKPAEQKPVSLKALQSPETAERVRRDPERTAALQPPLPAADTDFRNVRVLNASSPGEQWFKHTR